MVNKLVKICSPSLVIRGILIKTTVKYFTHSRMAIIKIK